MHWVLILLIASHDPANPTEILTEFAGPMPEHVCIQKRINDPGSIDVLRIHAECEKQISDNNNR